jgi:tetratricopeptide (TPR) repeat protein
MKSEEIHYYALACALKQNEHTAPERAQEFIDRQNDKSRVGMMSFHLAEYYFRFQDYSRALLLYEQSDIDNLSNGEISQMKFHQGYAYYTRNEWDKARPLLDAVRQLPKDPNYADANYYYGLVCFHDRKYGEALDAFRVVENNPQYEKIVPYYLANIYLMLDQKDKAIAYAEEKVGKGGQLYDLDLRQLVGHGYYEKQDFAKALPYLEKYVNQTSKVSREDLFELSYCYYQTKNWPKAIEGFKQLGGKEDSLAQNAMYLLGDAYLKTGQKANARSAFQFCSSNSSNEEQKQISLFNYAKISFELGYQDIALKELQEFLGQYPNSPDNTEARELLVSVLASTSNYREALNLVDSLHNPSANIRRIYPKILYGRAMEMVNDGNLAAADALLDKALAQPSNAGQLPEINFWKGEIAYRLNRIDDAIRYYFEYLPSGLINGEISPVNAKYNLGYCFLRKENYKQAQGFFEQIVRTPRINSSSFDQDVYIRYADCYFMNREFRTALAMYDKVLDFSWPASDYATFQKAMIAGVNNGNEKVVLLSSIPRKFPQSDLVAESDMEIASTYLANEQFKESLPFLKNVIHARGNDALKPKAYLRAGIAYYNLNNNKEALAQYDSLLKQYPNSPEASDGLDNAKSIYVEEGRTGEYVSFAKAMGMDISPSQEDQLAYQEAEVQFNNGSFPEAAQKFEDYLTHFPDGKYAVEAQFYKSEIYFNQNNWAKAVTGYQAVGDKAPNRYAEKALLQAARINFFYIKDYAQAAKDYARLKDFASTQENSMEAMRGLLRSQVELMQWSDALDNAKNLLNQKGIGSDDRELANLVIAKSLQTQGQCGEALTYFRTVAELSKAAYGAEARYQIAECLFEQNQLKDAEKAAFEVINKAGSYENWVVRAYLLLGDIYTREKDFFNAKATYQSVLDNAKEEDVRQQAQQRLNEVAQSEKANSKVGDN